MPSHTEEARKKLAGKLGTGLAGRAGSKLATRRSRIDAIIDAASAGPSGAGRGAQQSGSQMNKKKKK
jgi:hypothetical protein